MYSRVPVATGEEDETAPPLRLHLHACFRIKYVAHVRKSFAFLFRGSHPKLPRDDSAQWQAAVSGNQALSYVHVSGIGNVLTGDSAERFTC